MLSPAGYNVISVIFFCARGLLAPRHCVLMLHYETH